MNKKIAAIAVAGLFAAPVAALAQSSVTISGQFKGGMENQKLGNFSSARNSSNNSSQYGIVDDSSRIIFNVREDLGGGLSAIGQYDARWSLDVGNLTGLGNTHVGLESKSWGRIFFGRQDLHYFNTSGNISGKNSLRADSISVLAFAGAYGAAGTNIGGGVAIAGATRTANVLHYTTPNWGGFTAIVAYSSNPIGQDGDTAAGTAALTDDRKGNAWHLNPNYSAANWQVGWSYWHSNPDGGSNSVAGTPVAANDQRSNRLYGNYTFGFGLKVGLAWDKSKLENSVGNTTTSNRGAWSIPFQYSFMGKHQITGHYTRAKDDKANAADGLNTGAKMFAIGYSYDLSKRTSVGVTFAKINNDSNAGYQLFTAGGLGVGSGSVLAGEDPRIWGTTLRHAF